MALDGQIAQLKEKITTTAGITLTSFVGSTLEPDFSDNDYRLIDSNKLEFDIAIQTTITDITEFFGVDAPSDLTYLNLFNNFATEQIISNVEDDKKPSAGQLQFYKDNLGLFNNQQKDKIDKFLIISGDLENVSFPKGFILTKNEFDTKATEEANSVLSDADGQIDVRFINFKLGGLTSKQWEMFGSDSKVQNEIYVRFKQVQDRYGHSYSELENENGRVAQGEITYQIRSIAALEDITQNKSIFSFFFADTTPGSGQEILDEQYLKYVEALVEQKQQILSNESASGQQLSFSQIAELSYTLTGLDTAELLRKDFVFTRRLDKFNFLAEQKIEDVPDTAVAQQLSDEAQKNTNESLRNFGQGAEQDSPIDLEARQKVFEQCALLSDIKGLSGKYLELIRDELYSPRLYLVETNDSDSASNMNKLLLPMKEDIKSFLQITPDVAAMLVPKIRLFLVREIDGVTTKKEFKFPTSTTPNIESIFRGTPTGKGTEFGIKSFSFSFEGTNPATARNDITADLTLFFQNFNDFVSEEHDPKFVDLILYDKGKEKTAGFNAISKNQYSPDYYRILAEVGWQIPTDKSIIKEIEKRVSYKSLKNALRKTNKSFYLNMVEHDMDFKEDGTFEVKAQYRAYIESALKGPDFDALATPDILKRRFQRENQVEKLIESGVCNTEGLQQLARAFEVEDLEMIKDSYQSIISRLLCRDRIFVGKPKDEDINTFSRFGYFKKPCGWRQDPIVSSKDAPEAVLAEATSTQKSTVNFFFLGDLIYTILDSAYELGETSQFNRPFKNTNVVLFPFEIQDMEGKTIQLNIAEIPISVDFFIEWYTDNVIAVERKTYPIMNFIRDLTNKLVVDLLAEQCRYQPLENKFRFNTATIMAKGTDPLGRLTSNGTKKLDITKQYAASPPNLPLNTDDEKDSKFSDYHNYIIIYPVYSNIQHLGTGSEVDDGKRGTYHFDIGPSKGLVKRIKFSKVDMQYIREARFMQQGTQNLAQLAAVYKASIDMIGNTIYYPGMEVFINPRGLGIQGDPTTPGSVANVLGFGGYHLVTRVNSNISPSSFSTNIEAMFTYSGDGTPPLTISNLNQNDETKPIEDSAPTQACNDVIVVAESNAIKLFEADALDYENLQDINQKQAVPEDSTQAIPEDQ